MIVQPVNCPNDMRLAVLDRNHEDGARVLRLARQAAVEDQRARPGGLRPKRARLRKVMADLPTEHLNWLAVMWMIDDRFNGATGQGAVWAVASRVCNEEARALLRERPMFEAA